VSKKAIVVVNEPNPEPAPAAAQILQLNPNELTIHPLADRIPMLGQTHPEFVALVMDIAERGIDEPLKVDSHHRIMDGRHRRDAAIQADLQTVPCVVRNEEDALDLVIGSLYARRHFSDDLRAYLFAPEYETLLARNRERTLSNLKQGKTPMISRKPENPATGSDRVAIARRFGLSHDRLDTALALLKIFREKPELREKYEPDIYSGKWSLWNALSAVKGKEATEGITPQARPAGKLIEKTFRAALVHFKRWEKIVSKQERLQVAKALDELLRGIPDELVPAAMQALKEKAR
jgi:hypothetical protein